MLALARAKIHFKFNSHFRHQRRRRRHPRRRQRRRTYEYGYVLELNECVYTMHVVHAWTLAKSDCRMCERSVRAFEYEWCNCLRWCGFVCDISSRPFTHFVFIRRYRTIIKKKFYKTCNYLEIDVAVLVHVERPEHMVTKLLGIARRKEHLVHVDEFGRCQTTIWTILL